MNVQLLTPAPQPQLTAGPVPDIDDVPLMGRARKHLSVVIGCYNAARHLERRMTELGEFLEGLGRSHELIVVEDGSRDESLPILRRLEARLDSIRVLRNPRNVGKGFSIRNGILNSTGQYIIFTDADMAYSHRNLATVLESLEAGAPVVVGNRRLPESVYVVNNALVRYVYRRHRMGGAFNFVVRHLLGLTARDTQSGLKGFARPAAAQIFHRVYTDGFLFDVEIFIRSKRLGIPVKDVPVHITFEDDITTVAQFKHLFAVIPDLLHIKLLELRGAYDAPCADGEGRTR